jgi:hypothetical protein
MTDTPPPSPNPFGADAPTVDRTPQAIWAMATGAVAVVVWYAILTFVTTRMAAATTARTIGDVNPDAFYVNLIIYGAVLGLAFGGITSWIMMSGIPSSYRRGGLSLVSAFAGAVLGGVLTVMAKEAAGPGGLIGVAVLAFAAVLLLMRRTRRARMVA